MHRFFSSVRATSFYSIALVAVSFLASDVAQASPSVTDAGPTDAAVEVPPHDWGTIPNWHLAQTQGSPTESASPRGTDTTVPSEESSAQNVEASVVADGEALAETWRAVRLERSASPREDKSSGHTPDILWKDGEWRRFQNWQYGILAGMTGIIVTSALLRPKFEEPRWDAEGPFDEWVHDRTGGASERAQTIAGKTSDILYPTLGLLPLVLEDALMLPLARRSPDVALQTFLIDMQSLGFTAVFYFVGQAVAGRARPSLSDEIDEVGLEEAKPVGTGTKSFFSGHAAIAFTGASLMCTHQAYLDVYANDTIGRALCGTTMTAATAVSIFRIVDNRHWASDVLLGAGLGLFSGLALPRLIHFNPPRFGRRGQRQAFFFMVPEMQRDTVGLRMIGIF